MQQMNSIIMQDGSVRLKQVGIPKPAAGQVLVRSLACGICAPTFTLLDTRMRYLMYSTSSVDA